MFRTSIVSFACVLGLAMLTGAPSSGALCQDGVGGAADPPGALDETQPLDGPQAERPRPPREGEAPPRPEEQGGGLRPPPPGFRPPPPERLLDDLLPLIAEEHPDLARRIRRMRAENPREFRRVLAEALAIRLEDALADGSPPGPPPGMRRDGAPGVRPPRPHHPGEAEPRPEAGDAQQREELRRQHKELDERSAELARRYKDAREQGEGAEPELEQLRNELRETVERQFDVRRQLRETELHRVERDLNRLQETLEQIRGELERREKARDTIINRRMSELLGEGNSDW